MQDEEFIKIVSERLVYLRKKHDLSAVEVAKAIGKSVDAYYSYEAGRRMISADALYNLSNLYDMSIDDIVDNEVTYNREKVVSFEVVNLDNKIQISAENNEIIFLKLDDFTYEYYLKTNIITLDKKVLLKKDNVFFSGKVTYNEKMKVYSIYNYLDDSNEICTKAHFLKHYLVHGIYAGRIDKNINIPNFL